MSYYDYAGAMVIHLASSKFVTSLFVDEEGKYYIQEEDNDIITGFSDIVPSRKILPPKRNIRVSKGDNVIHTFLEFEKENEKADDIDDIFQFDLKCGDKNHLEKSLLPLLHKDTLPAYSKLTISLFLNLHQRTIAFIQASNKDLTSQGITELIDKDNVFSAPFPLLHTEDVHRDVNERHSEFKSVDPSITLEDIVFLNKGRFFFSGYEISTIQFINRNCLLEVYKEEMICQLIKYYFERDRHSIRIIISEHTEACNFFKLSNHMDMSQRIVESLLVETIEPQKDKSVIDICYDTDNAIHTFKAKPGREVTYTMEQENSLFQSGQTIISNFLKKL
ncbi:hypothetical protein AAHN97_16015 [Chitinophaga niabensis]|uniref:hypothetical protein n=1 Tax=Chitinophaga niabensis TaxID=536979 RepID=UPI0031BA208A